MRTNVPSSLTAIEHSSRDRLPSRRGGNYWRDFHLGARSWGEIGILVPVFAMMQIRRPHKENVRCIWKSQKASVQEGLSCIADGEFCVRPPRIHSALVSLSASTMSPTQTKIGGRAHWTGKDLLKNKNWGIVLSEEELQEICLLYTSPSPRDS